MQSIAAPTILRPLPANKGLPPYMPVDRQGLPVLIPALSREVPDQPGPDAGLLPTAISMRNILRLPGEKTRPKNGRNLSGHLRI